MNQKRCHETKKDDHAYFTTDKRINAIHMANQIFPKLPSHFNQPIIIVCIGTDRSTGDSLGPLVGTKLTTKRLSHFKLYGTLEHPVHATNLTDTIQEIECTYDRPFIIAIDACLGRLQNVGKVSFADGPLYPGSGVKKKLDPVGDLHIYGIVNVSGFMEMLVLQNTRLHVVMNMADMIASSLYHLEIKYVLHHQRENEKTKSFLI